MTKGSFLRFFQKIQLRKLINNQKGLGGIFIFVACAILLGLVYKERATLFEYQWQFHLEFLFLFIIFHILAMLVQTLAWHFLVTRLTGARHFWLDFKVYTISLVSRRIPGTIWYIGSKFVLYPSDLVSSTNLIVASGLEFGLIGIAGVICYILFFPLYSYTYNWPWEMLLGIGTLSLSILILKPGMAVDLTNWLLKKLRRNPILVTITRVDMGVWLLLYVLTWFLDGASFYFWIRAVVSTPVDFFNVVGVSTISNLVSYIAQFLPSGFALKEITMGSMLSIWIPVSIGVVLAIGYRIGMVIVEIFLALAIKYAAAVNDLDQQNKR
jgi:hypothetical protein